MLSDLNASIRPNFSTKKARAHELLPKKFTISSPPSLPVNPNKRDDPNYSEPWRLSYQDQMPTTEATRTPLLGSACFDHSIEASTYFEQCYRTHGVLGLGSFGIVFKSEHLSSGSWSAVKMFTNPFLNRRDRRDVTREVQKHQAIPDHHNIVRFIQAWEQRDILYLETELCESNVAEYATMFTHCSQMDRMPEKQVWVVFIDMIKALEHLHSHSLVHMDMKPDNILISRKGGRDVCKLTDLGLMLHLELDKPSDDSDGDARYLAKEVLSEVQISKAADIFSLGVTILEIATDLDVPIHGELWNHLRSGHLPEQLMTGLSPALSPLLCSMLSPHASSRPSCVSLLSHELTMEWIPLREGLSLDSVCHCRSGRCGSQRDQFRPDDGASSGEHEHIHLSDAEG